MFVISLSLHYVTFNKLFQRKYLEADIHTLIHSQKRFRDVKTAFSCYLFSADYLF